MFRAATPMVGVVPNAACRHFADTDQLVAAVCTAAMRELADVEACAASAAIPPRPRRLRRDGIECALWSAVQGRAVLAWRGPLRDVPAATRPHPGSTPCSST